MYGIRGALWLLGFWFIIVTAEVDYVSIGAIQGAVRKDLPAKVHRSPMKGKRVRIRGVVHQIQKWVGRNGDVHVGFCLQNEQVDADADAASSDALFVYCCGAAALPSGVVLQPISVGDRLALEGVVKDRYGQVELAEVKILSQETPGRALADLLKAEVLRLPEEKEEADRYLKSRVCMRVSMEAGAVALGGTTSRNKGRSHVLWFASPNNSILRNPDPLAARIFRDPHPLDDIPSGKLNNGNGRRFAIGSAGLWKDEAQHTSKWFADRRTGDVTTERLFGSLSFLYGDFRFQIDALPRMKRGAWTTKKHPRDKDGWRIVTFNLENLYDEIDDPEDACDALGDRGVRGVRKPFNYLPESPQAVDERLEKIAAQIVGDLTSPEVLLLQEVEDQDVDRNGRLDILERLVSKIVRKGGPAYMVLADRDGADRRGIICAFLVDPERFHVREPLAEDPVLGKNPIVKGVNLFRIASDISNPKAFNALYEGPPDSKEDLLGICPRPIQVLGLLETRTREEVWVLNAHFSSRPDRLVHRRRAQAGLMAALVQTIARERPKALLIAGGDLNVFPRPDDPFDPKSDQLAPLYAAGLANVYEPILRDASSEAYSYIYKGQAGTLDHLFVCKRVLRRISCAAFVHINADWSDRTPEKQRRSSDHDPLFIEVRPLVR